jgi:C4-dicarboxylate transporter DctM subunit
MDNPLLIGNLTLLLALIFMLLAVQVSFSLTLAGVLAFLVFHGKVEIAGNVFFDSTNNFTLTAVPLFVFLGEILLRCGASETIYRGTSKLFAWIPGGLLQTNIAACALFAAISGSSPATAATIGTVAIPALEKRGYNTRMTLGSLAAGGTLGILIPPSINMIVYGMVADTSIGRLFIGGVIPGIILSIIFMIYIAIRVMRNPRLAPRERYSFKEALGGIPDLWPALFLATIVLGGVFAGVVTATEAAALGASGALLIAATLRELTWKNLRTALANSVMVTSMVMFIYVGAMIITSFFGVMGLPRAMSQVVLGSGIGKYWILAGIYLLYIILGCFLDGVSMIVLTVPTLLPILDALGFDRVWFGIVLVVLCEIGFITPPMGLNLYVIQGISQQSFGEVVRGVVPYFWLMLLGLLLFTIFPFLATWLPSIMVS